MASRQPQYTVRTIGGVRLLVRYGYSPIPYGGTPTVPNPPTSVTVSSIAQTTATVSWTTTADASVIAKRVYVNGAKFGADLAASATTVGLTGLTANTPYTVVVTQVNSVGESSRIAASATKSFTTLPVSGTVPTAPNQPTVSSITQTGAVVTWTETADGTVTAKRVYLNGVKNGADLAAGALTKTLANLTPGTNYSVTVSRVNTVGESPQSTARPFQTTPPVSTGIPGQVAGKSIQGLATDTYATRVAETGPIGADRSYAGTWGVTGLMNLIKTAHSRGVLPYCSSKTNPSTWAQAAAGALDADATAIGNQIAALGYPVRLTFHHEPSGSGGATGAGDNGTLGDWRDMMIRLFGIIKPLAPNAALGPCDNGYKWSNGGQGWSDSQLATVYTDELLSLCHSLGADMYTPSTTSPPTGETAAVRFQNMTDWANRIGWTGGLDCGEWQFVTPGEATQAWNVMKANVDQWWLACAFDSDTNNRAGIPTIGAGWNFTHDYQTANDRLNAYKAILADPLSSP